MKHAILILCLWLSWSSAAAQFRMIGTATWTTLTDSTYAATINFQPDLTNNGYLATQVVDGFRMFTGTEQVYTVNVNEMLSTFSSIVAVVTEYNGDHGIPIGQVMVYDPAGRATIPQAPYGNTGSTSQMQAAVDTYNARLVGTAGVDLSPYSTRAELADSTAAIRSDFPVGGAVIDSTRLVQDSILVYYQDGVEVGRDTIAGTGGGGGGTITLSGDVTGSGTTAITTTIATGAVGPDELASTAVTPGSYTSADITVDSDGRITSAANGSGGGGADNLGNHTMTQNLQTNGNWISGDGGNEGIAVDASGKVGIGTLTPSANLDIVSSTDITRRMYSASPVIMKDEWVSGGFTWDFYWNRPATLDIAWRHNGVPKMTLTRDGNLAITGAFTFQGALSINPIYQINSSSNYIDLYDAASASMQFGIGNPTGGSFEWYNKDATEIMTLDRTGMLGLGRSNPSYVLDINSTDAIRLPVGTSAQRPTGANGLLRFSSTNNKLEAYYNAQWNAIASEGIEDDGSAAATTDGSGDITVSHTLGSASITVTATTTGTTFYHVQVHTKTSTNFKIRFFDATGAAVTATAVTADWIAKLQ